MGLGGGWMGGGGCGEEEEERRGFRRETWDHHFQPHFTLQLHRNRVMYNAKQYLLPPKESGYEAMYMYVSVSFASAPPQCNRPVPKTSLCYYTCCYVLVYTCLQNIECTPFQVFLHRMCVRYVLNRLRFEAYCPHNMCMHAHKKMKH